MCCCGLLDVFRTKSNVIASRDHSPPGNARPTKRKLSRPSKQTREVENADSTPPRPPTRRGDFPEEYLSLAATPTTPWDTKSVKSEKDGVEEGDTKKVVNKSAISLKKAAAILGSTSLGREREKIAQVGVEVPTFEVWKSQTVTTIWSSPPSPTVDSHGHKDRFSVLTLRRRSSMSDLLAFREEEWKLSVEIAEGDFSTQDLVAPWDQAMSALEVELSSHPNHDDIGVSNWDIDRSTLRRTSSTSDVFSTPKQSRKASLVNPVEVPTCDIARNQFSQSRNLESILEALSSRGKGDEMKPERKEKGVRDSFVSMEFATVPKEFEGLLNEKVDLRRISRHCSLNEGRRGEFMAMSGGNGFDGKRTQSERGREGARSRLSKCR